MRLVTIISNEGDEDRVLLNGAFAQIAVKLGSLKQWVLERLLDLCAFLLVLCDLAILLFNYLKWIMIDA